MSHSSPDLGMLEYFFKILTQKLQTCTKVKQVSLWKPLTTLSEILSEGDYLRTFGLSSGYRHIEINREHLEFLVFEMGL